jgi:hypothetical protein
MGRECEVLAEPFAVPDVYVTGLWNIEPLGHGDARFVFYTIRRGEPELAASLVAPIASIPPAILMGLKTLGVSCGACRVLKGQ